MRANIGFGVALDRRRLNGLDFHASQEITPQDFIAVFAHEKVTVGKIIQFELFDVSLAQE